MKTTRRDFLEPIRNPSGLGATLRNQDVRLNRIERAPVKFNVLKPNPPKKAPVVPGVITQPVALAAVLSFIGWSGSDPETALSEPFELINEENDSDYDVITAAAAKEIINEDTDAVDIGHGHYDGSPSSIDSWDLTLTPTAEGSVIFLLVHTLNDGSGSAWTDAPTVDGFDSIEDITLSQDRLSLFTRKTTAGDVSMGVTATILYGATSNGGSAAVGVEYSGSADADDPLFADPVTITKSDATAPYDLTIPYTDHETTWTMNDIGNANFMLGINVGLK